MLLWLIFSVMTAAAIAAVLVPLVRNRAEGSSNPDIAVYRDQLDEVDRDLATGLVGKNEAEAARVEISRRLLAAANAVGAAPTASDPASATRFRRGLVAAALLLLPAGAAALYLQLGSPNVTAELATGAAQTDNRSQIENLVVRVEAHLQKNPRDGRGWEVLAPVYMQLGRYSDSVSAWRNTLTLLGENAEREANLGEALMAEANGVVTIAAKAAFARAVALDDKIVSARYYLGRAAEQDGNREEAARIWRGLIAEAPAGAHWVNDVRDALARIESNSTVAPAASPGVAAVQQVEPAKSPSSPPPQHDDDVRGMVDRLAERVKKSGVDPEGWIMLTRSYLTMGDKEKAAAAIREARAAMTSDAAALQNFNEALERFKINEALNVASATPVPPAPEARAPARDGNPANEMIRGMVARLAERLKNDGSDLDGWLQLVRSYVVLGERDKALNAATDARRAVGNDAEKRQRIDDFIRSLGLEG